MVNEITLMLNHTILSNTLVLCTKNIRENNVFCNTSDQIFNFKNLLTMKDTIIWKNCNNLKIKIKSKINKMIFENCNNIIIQVQEAVCGVEFNKCNNVKIIIKDNINCIESYKSHISFLIKQKTFDKLKLISEKSHLIKLN